MIQVLGTSDLVSVAWRTFVFYLLALTVIRLMGKREVGRLSPMDLVVAIMIAETAVIAVEDPRVSPLVGIVAMVILYAAHVILTSLSMRFERLRHLMADEPTVVIKGGRLDTRAMRRQRYNLDDLLEQLRLKGYGSPADVEFAILETSGDLSVIPKSDRRPVQPGDLGLRVPRADLPLVVISDGRMEQTALDHIGKDERWLHDQLSRRGVESAHDVFLAVYLRNGDLFVQLKDSKAKL